MSPGPIKRKEETVYGFNELNGMDMVIIRSLTPLIPGPVGILGVVFENEKAKNQAAIIVALRTLAAKIFSLPLFILLQA